MGIIETLTRRWKEQGLNITLQTPNTTSVLGLTPEELYESQYALRAVVDFIARQVASTSLKCYIREGDDRKRDRESILAKTLLRPNDAMTTHELLKATITDICLHDQALWYILPTANGYSIEHIPAAWITDQPTLDGIRPTGYTITNPQTGKRIDFPAADCIRFSNYNPANPSNATSPVEALKDVLVQQISSYQFMGQNWKNGGRINAYISRPKDAPNWSPDARDRFVKSMREAYSGSGKQAGGMPLLADGMTIQTTQFNAHDAQFVEAITLGQEAVCAVYHVNPAVIFATNGQTYASVKENARALYVDTLGPIYRMLEARINTFLADMIGAPDGAYVEFDIDSKLAGDWETQTSVLTSAVGGPYMTRAEARAKMNLPKLDDEDLNDLIVPLNVLVGGQANPQDADSTKPYKEGQPLTKDGTSNDKEGTSFETSSCEIEIKADAPAEVVNAIGDTLRRFYIRQQRAVTSNIDRARDRGTLQDRQFIADPSALLRDEKPFEEYVIPAYFDWDRWNAELTADLKVTMNELGRDAITQALNELGDDLPDYDDVIKAVDALEQYIDEWTDKIAARTNYETAKALQEYTEAEGNEAAEEEIAKRELDTIGKYWTHCQTTRASNDGKATGNALNNIGRLTGVAALGTQRLNYYTKTWKTGPRSRISHTRMNGETVPYLNEDYKNPRVAKNGLHARFSNGQRFPGDYIAGDPGEVAGCNCSMVIRKSTERQTYVQNEIPWLIKPEYEYEPDYDFIDHIDGSLYAYTEEQ